MSVFEYAASILSIVIGLALAHLLGGISKILRPQHGLRTYWVATVWFIAMIFVNVGWWYAVWSMLRGQEEISFRFFVGPLLISMTLYVASRLLVPDFDLDHPTDLKVHFFEIRVAFFASLALIFISAVGLSSAAIGGPVSWLAIGTSVALPTLAIAGALLAHPRFQEVLCVVWLTVYLTQEIMESVIR